MGFQAEATRFPYSFALWGEGRAREECKRVCELLPVCVFSDVIVAARLFVQ